MLLIAQNKIQLTCHKTNIEIKLTVLFTISFYTTELRRCVSIHLIICTSYITKGKSKSCTHMHELSQQH